MSPNTHRQEILVGFTGGAQGTGAATTNKVVKVFGQEVTTEANGVTATVTAIPVFDYAGGGGGGGGVSNPVIRTNSGTDAVWATTNAHAASDVKLAVQGTLAVSAGTVRVTAGTMNAVTATVAISAGQAVSISSFVAGQSIAVSGTPTVAVASNTSSVSWYLASAPELGAESASRVRGAVWAAQDGDWFPKVTRDDTILLHGDGTDLQTIGSGAVTANLTSGGTALTDSTAAWVNLMFQVSQTGNPGQIYFIPQARKDGIWADYDAGYVRHYGFEDQQISSGVTKCLPPLPLAGNEFRILVSAQNVISTKQFFFRIVAQAQNIR